MPVDLEHIPRFFTRWIAANGNRGAVGEVAQWLADGSLDPTSFAEIVERNGCSREVWFRDGMVDLVLAYATERLTLTRRPEIPDVSDIRLLQLVLHIDEDEFFFRRPAELSRLIQDQFDFILEDGVIDGAEDLYLVELQAAFQLGYDELMILARPAIERAVVTLETGLGMAGQWNAASRRAALEKLTALEPTYLLATANQRSLGALY
jgi:hypothetical protein